MASLLNSVKDLSINLVGEWEDVKDYTSAIITLRAPVDGSGYVQWAHTDGRRLPDTSTDIIASERFEYLGGTDTSVAVTKQFDHRARWFRVIYDHSAGIADGCFNDLSFNLQTLYKKAPTELKLVDDSANIVSVNVGDEYNSLYTMLTDSSGQAIRTTNDFQTEGEALFTHLADSSGRSLATTDTSGNDPESLFVALRDGSNNGLSSTGVIDTCANALFVRPGDASGNAQASTFDVSGAHTKGVALYAALADNCGFQIDTTNKNPGGSNNANALYVHLALEGGISVDKNNPLPVVNTQESIGALAFDVSHGIEERFISPLLDLSSTVLDNSVGVINLYNFFVYNDSPVTVWVKVYDTCFTDLSDNGLLRDIPFTEPALESSMNVLDGSGNLKYNLTVPGGRVRDLVLPGGATFYKGLHVRATTQYKKFSVYGPGPNNVFINGTYTKE